MNKIIISGRMTKDPETRTTLSGKTITSFVVATDRPYINSEGRREADFIPVIVWDKTANYVKEKGFKSCKVVVEGRLQILNFDSKDGTRHWIAEIVGNLVEIYSNKAAANANNVPPEMEACAESRPEKEQEDDLQLDTVTFDTFDASEGNLTEIPLN